MQCHSTQAMKIGLVNHSWCFVRNIPFPAIGFGMVHFAYHAASGIAFPCLRKKAALITL